MSLEVKIKKRMGDFCLDVEFTSESGVTGLLGASGCGKSLTLRSIAGIIKPDEGYIVLNGKVLFDSRQKVSLPPQKTTGGISVSELRPLPQYDGGTEYRLRTAP